MASLAQPSPTEGKELGSWNVDEVVSLLKHLELDSLTGKFKENAVTGQDLEELDEDGLQSCLGLTKLQARKIRRQVEALSGKQRTLRPDTPEQTPPTNASPAPARPAPLPAAKQSQVDAADLRQYARLTELIKQLQSAQVEVQLSGQEARLAGLQQTLRAYQHELSDLHQKAVEEEEKQQKIATGGWYPGKIVRGKSHHQEKEERLSKAAAEAAAAEKAAAARLSQLQAEINTQMQALNDTRAKLAELQRLRAAEAALIQRLFAGETAASDAREQEIEDRLDALTPKMQETERVLRSYLVGEEAMRAAHRQLQAAGEELQRAFGMSQVDIAGDFFRPGIGQQGFIGLAADIGKRQAMRNAQELVHASAQNIQQARTVLPSLPGIDVGKIKGLNNIWGDLVFDNIISDMRARQKIIASQASIASMAQDTHHAMRWASDWTTRIKADLGGLQSQHATLTAELHSYRIHLLEEASRQTAAPAPSSQPPVMASLI